MRFMILVKADKNSEAGVLPDEKLLTEMGKFNEELVKAGVMLAGEGLQSSTKGARIKFSGSKRTVIDGPFAETKELVAGYWLRQVKSKDEAIEWVKRWPVRTVKGESRSRFVRFSRRRISGPSLLLSSGNRRSACARRWTIERRRRSTAIAPQSTGGRYREYRIVQSSGYPGRCRLKKGALGRTHYQRSGSGVPLLDAVMKVMQARVAVEGIRQLGYPESVVFGIGTPAVRLYAPLRYSPDVYLWRAPADRLSWRRGRNPGARRQPTLHARPVPRLCGRAGLGRARLAR